MKEIFWQNLESGLEKLRAEIEQFSSDEALWAPAEGTKNPAGTLCLHLLGNLDHYIGAKLGNTGYVRDRPSEFTTRGVTRAELIKKVDETYDTMQKALLSLSAEKFDEKYPDEETTVSRTVAEELIHIVMHFNYHLGQINYYRRLTDKTDK